MYISTADLSGNSLTTNPNAKTNFIIPEGYSVKENTDIDKEEFPYLVSAD